MLEKTKTVFLRQVDVDKSYIRFKDTEDNVERVRIDKVFFERCEDTSAPTSVDFYKEKRFLERFWLFERGVQKAIVKCGGGENGAKWIKFLQDKKRMFSPGTIPPPSL